MTKEQPNPSIPDQGEVRHAGVGSDVHSCGLRKGPLEHDFPAEGGKEKTSGSYKHRWVGVGQGAAKAVERTAGPTRAEIQQITKFIDLSIPISSLCLGFK